MLKNIAHETTRPAKSTWVGVGTGHSYLTYLKSGKPLQFLGAKEHKLPECGDKSGD